MLGLILGCLQGSPSLGLEFGGPCLRGSKVSPTLVLGLGERHFSIGANLIQVTLELLTAGLLDRFGFRLSSLADLLHLELGTLHEFIDQRGTFLNPVLGFSDEGVSLGLSLSAQLGKLCFEGAASGLKLSALGQLIGFEFGEDCLPLVIERPSIMGQGVGRVSPQCRQLGVQQFAALGLLSLELRAAFIEFGVELFDPLCYALQNLQLNTGIALVELFLALVGLDQHQLGLLAGLRHHFTGGALGGLVQHGRLLGSFLQQLKRISAGLFQAGSDLNPDLFGLGLGLDHLAVCSIKKFTLLGQLGAGSFGFSLCFGAQLVSKELGLVQDLGCLPRNLTIRRPLAKQRIHFEHPRIVLSETPKWQAQTQDPQPGLISRWSHPQGVLRDR